MANYSQYYFHPDMLSKPREKGISAFMRIRNGEDFLKLTIESHISFFDEIIACYNQCTDSTKTILEELEEKYPEKLKIYHYEPKVCSLASPEHKAFANQTSKLNIVHSMANYSNFALSKTTKKIAVKLDDDHLAISENLSKALNIVRKNGEKNLYTFSGINLLSENNKIGVAYNSAFSGNGDILFFPVSNKSFFVNGPFHEKFTIKKLKTTYLGLLYLHLKFLKKDQGLSNYELNKSENVENSYYSNLTNLIKNNLVFMDIKAFSKTPLKKCYQLSAQPNKTLLLLKYPLLDKLILKIRHNNLHLNRALGLKKDTQEVLLNWEKIKNSLKKAETI